MTQPWMQEWMCHRSTRNLTAMARERRTRSWLIMPERTVERIPVPVIFSRKTVPTSRRATRIRSRAVRAERPDALSRVEARSRYRVSPSWNAMARRCVPRPVSGPIPSVCCVAIHGVRFARSDRTVLPIRTIRGSGSACDSGAGRCGMKGVREGRRVDVGHRHGQRVFQQRFGGHEPAFDESGGVQARMHRQHRQ